MMLVSTFEGFAKETGFNCALAASLIELVISACVIYYIYRLRNGNQSQGNTTTKELSNVDGDRSSGQGSTSVEITRVEVK